MPIPEERTMRTALPCCAIGLIAAPADAQIVYDTISAGTDGVAFIGDLVLDDLQVDGGGLLQTVTIALTAEVNAEGTTLTDVTLSLAVDGGDGFPDLDGTGDDSFLFSAFVPGVEVAVGGVTVLPVDVSGFYPLIPEDALLFGGVMLSNPDTGHLFYGAPAVGSTNPTVFSFNAMGPVNAPGIDNPKLTNSLALAFELDVVQLPGPGPAHGVVGSIIDFESLAEGFHGTSVTVDGVTFSEGSNNIPPPAEAMFAADDGTGVWDANPDMLDFVGGKLLQLNAFSSGPDGYVFSAAKSMRITPGAQRSAARVSVAYVVQDPDTDFSTATITLLALDKGQMVASRSVNAFNELGVSGGGSFTFGASELWISGVFFDDLVLFTNGPGPFGTVRLGIDNLELGTATCPTGDIDENGVTGTSDLLFLLANWGPCPAGLLCSRADLDGNSAVGTSDLLILLANWGECR
jgi:hypothetical protein